jgi:sortase A
MNSADNRTFLEQIALLFASFVWTAIVLAVIILFWVYQDVQARWEYVLTAPPEVLAQAGPPTATPSPTATLWPGPGPTPTPTVTRPPTPTATRVIQPPDILPETLNPDDPTPIPVIVHTEDEAVEFGLEQSAPAAESSVTSESPQVEQTPVQNPVFTPEPPAPVEPAPSVDEPVPAPAPGGEFLPARLVIDSVDIDSEVIPVGWTVVEQSGRQYSIWQVADYAVGWHKTTAKLGQAGNTVMAGHHNVNGEVFRDLVNVEVGDTVVVYDTAGNKFEYVIELKTIVKEKGEPLEVRQRNAQWIAPTDDERLTFVTCWPYTNNTHRVIVVAKPA